MPGPHDIRQLPADRESLASLIALHHLCLPSRLYATPQQQAAFLDEVLDALAGRESLVLASFADASPVAYKIAYRTGNRHETLYSWLGGVHPSHRGRGHARALLLCQHQLASAMGVTQVETHVWGDNTAMLVLNLRQGFHVAGTVAGPDKPGVRVILRKSLVAPTLPR
ncbi:MAG: GNAT family N-acetyltransferase [Planctomycetes bacterium]|nr:GNAT family N-acetyltransferase [Planctomycetota bacterium]MCW8137242.1 GNAT family N-acetyltransferase [Planctomycetota bacterium]